jgi:hypothetical protein
LFADKENQSEVVKILDKYTFNKFILPSKTIEALENSLGIPLVCDMALKAL